MPRNKIYTEEFLVRTTLEERQQIDVLAKRSNVSRSRFLVVAALSDGMLLTPESLSGMESMMELRGMALMNLKRLLNRLNQIADTLPQPESFDNAELTEAIRELTTTLLFLKEQWANRPSQPSA
jgi:hypothetical protein